MFTVRGLQLMKTNMVVYRTQKVAGSWIADGVFISSHAALRVCDASPIV